MEAVIKGGGSVLHGGRIIVSLSDLPKDSELAKGDPDAEKAALVSLQAEIDAKKAELAELQKQTKTDAVPKDTSAPPAK